jgi:tetratricopeptide (TPR) repeat protein
VEDSPTATTGEKVQVCERLIGIAPLDLAAATTLVDALSGEDAAKRALELAAVFGSAGLPGEQIQLLERAKSAAPREVKIRRELTEVWRTSGNQEKLTAELLGICEVAKGKHAARVREAALEELSGLPSTPELALQLAPLFLAAGNTDKAVESYCSAAEQLCEAGRFGECADAMRTVCTLEAASVPSALVAALIRKSDFADEVRPAVEQVLDAALLARSRTRTLVICAAMLESCRAGEVRQVLSRVFEKSGAAFLSAVAGVHLDWLLDRNRKDGAREIVDFIVSIAPSSPDVWWLASQTHRKAGDPERSKEASIQAAKLFSQAGAVTEEETCYREVLEETPDDAAVLETLVSLYEREHRVPDALELMRRLADLALKSGDHLGAVRWLGKLVENEPDNTDCREKLAEQLIQSAQPAEAAAELFELGRAYTTQGATEKAFAAYERILVLEPESEEAVTALVALAEKSNDAGRYSRCSQMLADVKAARGEVQEACRILRLLAEKEPDNLKVLEKLLRAAHGAHDNRAREYALRTLGYKHAKRGEHEAAVTSFEQLLGLCPGERDTVQMLVDCCAAGGLGQKAADYSSMLLETVRGQGDNTRICEAARAVLAFDAKRAPARRDLAEALFALGNPEEAVVEWTQAADDFEAAKNHADAESCLVRVTATTPGDAGAWRRYIQVLSVTGSEDAVAEARLRLAEALAEAGDIDAAEEALEQVLADAPGRPEIHERILAFYRRCGTASEILPELVWLAHYHLFHGDLDAAEQHVKEGLETDSEDMTLLECRIEIVRRQGKRDELQFRLRQLAQNCIGHGDLRKAADVFGEMVGEDPGLVDVRRELADLLLKLGEEERACNEFAELVAVQLGRSEVEDARETAEAALAVRPDDILLRARFAKVFADNRLPEIAGRHYMACAANAIARGAAAQQIEYLKQAVETRPRWVESLSQLAGACVAAGESAGALDALARLTEVLLDQKRVHEAIDALRRQVQLAPRDASLRRRLIDLLEVTGDRESRTAQLQELGDLFISLGDVEEAVETYRLLTSLKPGDAATLHRFIELFAQVGNELEVIDDYLRLAEIYAKTGSFEEATRTFERVLAIDRRQRDAREKFIVFLQHAGQKSRAVTEMVKLAEMHSSVCDFVAAAQTLTKAAMLSPHDVNVTEALGEAHALAGNTTAAAEALLKVVRSASGSDPARAVAACRRVVEIDPDNVDAREVIGDLLFGFGERAEAAGNARSLAQLYRSAGQVARAEALEQKAREYEPETVESMRELIRQHEGDQRQLLEDYVRYGDLLAAAGEIDGALGAYREARGIRDDNPELIRKYVNVLMQIAPEHEAIPDLIALAKGYEKTGAVLRALAAYEQVLKLDGKNSIAKAGRRRMREMSNAD